MTFGARGARGMCFCSSPARTANRTQHSTPKYHAPERKFIAPSRSKRQVVIVGGGHNGLVCAGYIAKTGRDVLVLERRDCVGGAAVTEEMIEGFKFSRASYLAGLLRPDVISHLDLHNHGLKYITRDPSSITPTLPHGPHEATPLVIGSDSDATHASIAQFSTRDADAYFQFEDLLHSARELVQPLLNHAIPFNGAPLVDDVRFLTSSAVAVARHARSIPDVYELFTAPASHLLDRWFESDVLKTTLATDAVIGSLASPHEPGSGYVLLHHVMGEAAGKKGVWAYVQGGMGAVSSAIASSATAAGAEILTSAVVDEVVIENGRAIGVRMDDGTMIHADIVISNATPHHTFFELLPEDAMASGLPLAYRRHITHADYSCGAFKLNLAVDKLPAIVGFDNHPSIPGPQHRGTIHFENAMSEIVAAHASASTGQLPLRPVVEMTIPSSLDPSLCPPGNHVVQLFVQYAPYRLAESAGSWDDVATKNEFINRILAVVEDFAPGFKDSIIGMDALSPLDLERVFGLHQGNIFHGALALHQLGPARPVPGHAGHRTPIPGLFLCGAGCHPGGGVMGAAGRNCARAVMASGLLR